MIVDPERLRAYLQMVCSGLGFDIGEVWMTSTNGSSCQGEQSTALTTATELRHAKHIRFIQLYTSRSYDDKRSKLVAPSQSVTDKFFRKKDGFIEVLEDEDPVLKCEEAQDVEKHLISPRLVDVITDTSQVVWANCQKQEGLLGRSDMRLQTAVGMPIMEDGDGHMCVLVMFSPDNIHSTDDAMEYLQFIRKTAMSASIPSLMPAIRLSWRESAGLNKKFPPISLSNNSQPQNFGEGVVARFVSFKHREEDMVRDVRDAPKDCFGIPMLPDDAEFGSENDEKLRAQSPFSDASSTEAFDEASYGIWSTVMQLAAGQTESKDAIPREAVQSLYAVGFPHHTSKTTGATVFGNIEEHNASLDLIPRNKQERLEEFAVGFLGMSAFDVADVWVPLNDGQLQVLRCVATASSSAVCGEKVDEFKQKSLQSSISVWSGAVGRAFGSGNPVWSSNYNVICDSVRSDAFKTLNIKTALAIPASSPLCVSPAFVICFYSMVRVDSAPVVLKFLQQAIRLVWDGLEKVVPTSEYEGELWNDVYPADLGEMAADLEMQHAFSNRRKRALSYSDLSFSGSQASQIPLSRVSKTNRDKADFGSNLLNRQLGSLELFPQNDSVSLSTINENPNFSEEQMCGTCSTGCATAFSLDQSNPTFSLSQQTAMQTNAPNQTVQYQGNYPIQNFDDHRHQFLDGQQMNQIGRMQFQTPEFPFTRQQNNPQPIMQPIPPSNVPQSHIAPQLLQPIMQPIPPSNAPESHIAPQLLHHRDHSLNLSSEIYAIIGDSPTFKPSVAEGFTETELNSLLPLQFHSQEQPLYTISGEMSGNVPTLGIVPRSGTFVPYTSFDATNGSWQHSVGELPHTETFEISERKCRIEGCTDFAIARRPYCFQHNGSRLCEHSGCTKCAQGATKFCIAHGGGRRCTFPGCDKGARDKLFCAAHGGGKRCSFDGCKRSAVGGSSQCTAHGGGRRCLVEGCSKSAQSSTSYCVKHGGGKKCEHSGCKKVARGRTLYCAAHGGGVRCRLESCSRVAVGKQQLCRVHGGGSRQKAAQRMDDNWLIVV